MVQRLTSQPAQPLTPATRAAAPLLTSTPTIARDSFQSSSSPDLEESDTLGQVVNQIQSKAQKDLNAVKQVIKQDHGQGADAPPSVTRSPYTGGAPALKPDEMDPAVVKNNLILRGLYGLPDRLQGLTRGYQLVTRVAGPLGALAFFGLNIKNSITFLKDPKSPLVLKAGIVGATALSGASAIAATRLGLSALKIAPMGATALKTFGRFAGVTGLGAGTLLAAMDTFNTFRNPHSTAAQKGFSLLGTAASGGLLAAMALGVTFPPLGIGLGIAAVAFPLMKMFLGNNPTANKVFGAIGDGIGKAGAAVGHVFGGAAHAVGSFFSSL